jgi:hypothetical protein
VCRLGTPAASPQPYCTPCPPPASLCSAAPTHTSPPTTSPPHTHTPALNPGPLPQPSAEGVHSREAIDMVKEHVLAVLGPASMAFSNTMIKMSKLQAAQVGGCLCACVCFVVGWGGGGMRCGGRAAGMLGGGGCASRGRQGAEGAACATLPTLPPPPPACCPCCRRSSAHPHHSRFCPTPHPPTPPHPPSTAAGLRRLHHVWLLPSARGHPLPAGAAAGRAAAVAGGRGRQAGAPLCAGGGECRLVCA